MTTQSKHTPGPWEAREYTNSRVTGGYGVFAQDSNILIVEGAYGEDIATADANARLIAAAPELLLWIEREIQWLEHIQPQIKAPDSVMLGFGQAIKSGKKAIAKARGE